MAANWFRRERNDRKDRGGRSSQDVLNVGRRLDFDRLEDRTVPAIVVQAPTNASRSPGHDAETDLAVNPTNPNNVVASVNEVQALVNGQDIVYTSFDAGQTWQRVIIPDNAGATGAGDPTMSFGRDGRLVFTHLEQTANGLTIASAASTDGGLTWTAGLVDAANPGLDKNWTSVGPDVNNPAQDVYYTGYQSSGAQFVSRSTDGITWSTPVLISPTTGNGVQGINVHTAVDRNGIVYAAWQDNGGNPGQQPGQGFVFFTSSADGGLTWTPARTIANTTISAFNEPGGGQYVVPAAAQRGVGAFIGIAVDRSGGANDGNVYVVYIDEAGRPATPSTGAARANCDVFMTTSRDGGATFDTPVRVNDDATVNSQFIPSVEVDNRSGSVIVAWEDIRDDPNNVLGRLYMAESTNGGRSFNANIAVSPGQTNANVDGFNYGEYVGLDVINGVGYVSWTDASNSTGDNPDGTGAADTYVSRFTVSAAPTAAAPNIIAIDASFSMDAVEGIDVNGDGVIDSADDFNGDGATGTLLDVAGNLAQAQANGPTSEIVFAKEAQILTMAPSGASFTAAGADVDRNGVLDSVDTLKTFKVGQAGYFSRANVTPDPTNYDSVLAAIAQVAQPGTAVTIYSDGSGRLSANSTALQALVLAGVKVNTVTLGQYQTIAPVNDFVSISTATGGTNTSLSNLQGRVLDGGYTAAGAQTIPGGGGQGPGAGASPTGGGGGNGGGLPGGLGGLISTGGSGSAGNGSGPTTGSTSSASNHPVNRGGKTWTHSLYPKKTSSGGSEAGSAGASGSAVLPGALPTDSTGSAGAGSTPTAPTTGTSSSGTGTGSGTSSGSSGTGGSSGSTDSSGSTGATGSGGSSGTAGGSSGSSGSSGSTSGGQSTPPSSGGSTGPTGGGSATGGGAAPPAPPLGGIDDPLKPPALI